MSARISASGDKFKYINDGHTPAELSQSSSQTIGIAVIKGS